MNQKTTYEITISRKLEFLPLPDLQDTIWNRIKEQLDTDMPTDDKGPDTAQGPTKPGSHILPGISGPFLVAVAVVASLLFLSKNQNKRTTAPAGKPALIQQETQSQHESDKEPSKAGKNIALPLPADKTGSMEQPEIAVFADSATVLQQDVLAEPAIDRLDSLNTSTVNPLPIQPPAVLPKKSRGVTGIKDGDYRLVPAADSSGRKKN